MGHCPLTNICVIGNHIHFKYLESKVNKMSNNHSEAEKVLNNTNNVIDAVDIFDHNDIVSFVT